ncbi:hypothetical protein LXL04_001001 [Taraxacum kok-saghyz]
MLLRSSDHLDSRNRSRSKWRFFVIFIFGQSMDNWIFYNSTTPARGAAPWTPPEAAAPDPAVRGCRPRTPAVRKHPNEL